MTAIGTGEPRYEEMFRRLAENHPDKIGVRVTYNDELAHKIEAGADMFLMPAGTSRAGSIRSTASVMGRFRLCAPQGGWMIPSMRGTALSSRSTRDPRCSRRSELLCALTKT